MKKLAVVSVMLVPLLASLLLLTGAQKKGTSKNPHKKLSRACEECHTPASFKDIEFNHNTTTFPLEGHHDEIKCLQCHSVTDFSKVEKSCVSCHEDAHLGQLGADCANCHNPDGWDKFDGEEIHSRTGFPLVGRHVMLDCETCHPGHQAADFAQTPLNCVNCHQQEYLEVQRPNHVASGFPTDCRECHEAIGWRPALMPDHDAVFPIFSGAHRNKWDDCVVCHTDPGNQKVFSCLGCHSHNQTLMNPVHQGITGYAYSSGSCYSCHPTGEAGRFVEHDGQFFPIFSGVHNGKWSSCVACHTNATNRKVFSCLQCHVHNQALMDPAHQGFAGYAYSSTACYGCHPTGERGQFQGHDAFFPIYSGGPHAKFDSCTTCHPNPANRKEFTCFNCHAHDQSKMDEKHVGKVNGYSYSPSACYNCHPNGKG
jgi:hypothetical protein